MDPLYRCKLNYAVPKVMDGIMHKVLCSCCLIFLLLGCHQQQSTDKEGTRHPNILLLVADDLGYSDLGSYGSNIDTPNLDQLAGDGLRLSRFHTAPLCAPSRAMLLSGNDNHVAGMGSQFRDTDFWGYEGHLTDRIATIPQLLRQAGYHTYITGKWHLGGKESQLPPSKGFDRSFVLHQGAANHYNNTGLSQSFRTADYSVDGQPVSWPEGEYSTQVYTDSLIKYIKENKDSGSPFFAYAAYTSPHWPLQVDESFWQKYEGDFDQGYKKLREQRLASLKEAGMVAEDQKLPPLHEKVRPWDKLSPREKKREARKMELYAGMVDNLDHHIGRVIQMLKDIGEYKNTVIVFMSDNGAAGEDFYNHPNADFLRSKYDNSLENMGTPRSFVSYGPPWAEAGSAPFRYFKGYTYEGGIVAPMIIRSPTMETGGDIYDGFTILTDLAPTFYEIAGVSYPDSLDGSPIRPLPGTSLTPILQGDTAKIGSRDNAWIMEHEGRLLVRKGDWKLVSKEWVDTTNFELYNLARDPSESHNVKDQHPGKFQELIEEWKEYKRKYNLRESF